MAADPRAGLETRIDSLRRELAAAEDDDRRHALGIELAELNRQKVLVPLPADPDQWESIPVINYEGEAAADEQQLRDAIKLFLKGFASAVDATFEVPGETQFVTLFRFRRTGDSTHYTLICPFRGPVAFMLGMQSPARRDELIARARSVDVTHKHMLQEGELVPLVVVYDPGRPHVGLFNENHFANPGQFLSPELCRTTSGLLNFIGALELTDGPKVFSDLEQFMNSGLDDWFRWLYCALDTGTKLDDNRLRVRRGDPERYVYDYDGETG